MSATRITMSDTVLDMMKTLADGSSNAVLVLAEVFTHTPYVDPDDTLEGLGPFFGLDRCGIYGERIWKFYSELCERKLSHMLALLRVCQKGIITAYELRAAIDGTLPLQKTRVDALLARAQQLAPSLVI